MPDEQARTTKVEELGRFPFGTFAEYRKAYLEGIITPAVNRGTALNWAIRGAHDSWALRAQVLLLTWLPALSMLGFIIYAVATKTWLLLLALPVLLMAFLVFHPTAVVLFGRLRLALILLTFVGSVWAFLTNRTALLALTLAVLAIWYGERAAYNKAVRSLIAEASKDEHMLCLLWQGNAVMIRFQNGNEYHHDWKIENGVSTHYEVAA